MDNPRPEKVAVVDEVRGRLEAASGAILTEYRGLTVKDIAGLRRNLRDAGGDYGIYKNTLVRFAARDLGLEELEQLLVGPTAIAFVDGDAAAVAKALRDFARTNPNLVVKGGVLGNKVLSAADTTALADLPSREVLLARLAGAFAAPMQQFAGLLQALPRNLAYGLKALIDKGGAGGAGAEAPASAEEPAGEAPTAATDDTPTATADEPAAPDTSAADTADTATTNDATSNDATSNDAAEALASGDTDQPAPTADDVHEAVEESTQE